VAIASEETEGSKEQVGTEKIVGKMMFTVQRGLWVK
jgi:hypothetical protein